MVDNNLEFNILEIKPHEFIIELDLQKIDSQHLNNILLCLELLYPNTKLNKNERQNN